jgi:BASS family bile acid:Na+ symporter
MNDLLVPLLKLSVTALIFAIGLGSTLRDVAYLWRRPWLALRSLLAMYVLVPLAALLVVRVVALTPAVAAALLVLAVSAGAPLLPRKLSKIGSGAYPFSLVVCTSVLAIVVVPTWIGLLARHFGVDLQVSPGQVARVIGTAFLLPLAAGMVVRRLMPRLADRVSDPLIAVFGAILTLTGIVLLATHNEIFQQMRGPGMLALVVLLVASLIIGHALGGPSPDDRTTLAVACATRHVGLAVLVASLFPGPRVVTLIATYVVASAAVSVPYLLWRKRAIAE